jgi:hypothetical protein
MSDHADDAEDGVGYGRPPRHTRFQPGQSGNPRGRPRKSRNINDLITKELDTCVTITEDGKTKRITKREAIPKRLVNLAVSGDQKAIDFLIKHEKAHGRPAPFDPTENDQANLQKVLQELAAAQRNQNQGGDDDSN